MQSLLDKHSQIATLHPVATGDVKMNEHERKYHKWVLVLSVLALWGSVGVWMVSIPAAVSWKRIILHCTPVTILALGLALTAAIHQVRGRLLRGVMIPQIVLLFLTIYGIPLGIWGIRLRSRLPNSVGHLADPGPGQNR
jgi:hypothetical protein